MALTSKANRFLALTAAGFAAAVCLVPPVALAAGATPPPAPSCPADLPEIVVPAPIHGAPTTSTRVLRVVARNQSHFAVQISFEGPFAGGTQAMQAELMRSVAEELGLSGAPDPEE